MNSLIDLCRCDGGAVYVLRQKPNGTQVLTFEAMVTRSKGLQSVPKKVQRMEFKVDEFTIVGKTAKTRRFVNQTFTDHIEVLDYKTRNLLSGPLLTPRGELVGVVQLINKGAVPGKPEQTVEFDAHDESLFRSVAGHAALAIENSFLLQEQEGLLQGFVDAFVTAVEARDPVTSGHSKRVADLSMELAYAVNRETTGALAAIKFSDEQLREIQYSAMLHDIGKVSVNESVLNKEKKLYAHELDQIRLRLELIKSQLRYADTQASSIDIRRQLVRLEKAWTEINIANEPTVLPEDVSVALSELGKFQLQLTESETLPLLTEDEIKRLSIKRGSLTDAERREIEKHVTFTYEILRKIPWSRGLRDVPKIAYCHHERMDGSGYPQRLRLDEIPMQGRLMAICDIYDALTADDRPYKRALSHQRAIEIIEMDVKAQKLDQNLFRCFLDSKSYEIVRKISAKGKKAA
ncbi:MAG: HD domain-containing protein [Bdellovibrionales bacterium]|nr:HD domain-containing protein [Bdellovibrionales bacterium]